MRIEVVAEGYEPFDRNVALERTGIDPVRLTPNSKELCITVGSNPPLSKLADMLAQSRHIRVAFSRLCTSKTKEATVEMNGAELCAKSDKEFLESAKARTSINFEVTVIQDGASYEITCP